MLIVTKRDDADDLWKLLVNESAEDLLKKMSEKHCKSQSITSRVKTLQSEIAAGLLIYNEKKEINSTPVNTSKELSTKKSRKKSKSSKKGKK